jgi:hypothetical protein
VSGNRASIGLLSVRPAIRCFGWLFQSMQLDQSADGRAVGGLRPIDHNRRCWPDIALENRHRLRISCQAHAHGRSNPTLPAVPLAPPRTDDLKKQLAD